MSSAKKVLSFVTTNMNKLAEVGTMLPDYLVQHVNLDTVEIQGTYREVVVEKCLQAYRQTKSAVLVEDTSLIFNAFGNLPGPYIKEFYLTLKPAGLYKLLAGFEDKSAKAVCVFAYLPQNSTPTAEEVQVFEGICPGHIVEPRLGEGVGFGWDPCFQPEGFTQTFAEMPASEKHKISHRSRALQALKNYFEKQQ
ncbi:Inosine triphosphate pyrophosphatase [Aphelenchoides bicaudatus]|nr:Inosine triphosphate pyrophosphatase [Aphelenchoides bicaudatus]